MSTNDAMVRRRVARSGATAGSSIVSSHAARSVICMAAASAMLTSPIFEERAPSLRRVPPQSGHGWNFTARSTNARMCGCNASRSFCSMLLVIFGTMPS